MSNVNHEITNDLVIPVIESGLFAGHDDVQFAIGMLAVGDETLGGLDNEVGAYYLLRGNVYHRQTRMIGNREINEDGGDKNVDDSRSVHFGIFERGVVENTARGVAAMRLILKTAETDGLLPIEEFYPEAFEDRPAPLGSTEVSRYIVRHENARVQKMLSDPLFSAALAHIMANELGPTLAVVEPFLETELRAKRVPFERIADPKYVPEYDDDNLAIRVDTTRLAQVMESRAPGTLAAMREAQGSFTYFGGQASIVRPAEAVA